MPNTDWETDLESGTYRATVTETTRTVGDAVYQFAYWRDNLGQTDVNLQHIFSHPIDTVAGTSTLTIVYSAYKNSTLTVTAIKDSVAIPEMDFTLEKL